MLGMVPLVTGCAISCDKSFCGFITCNVRLVLLGVNRGGFSLGFSLDFLLGQVDVLGYRE